MIFEIFLFGTAVIFTLVGYFMGKRNEQKALVEAIIDQLINDGYLKTNGYGENLEIIKHSEWCDDKATR
jgi:hypothetical protein|tara:strand:- start:158 stop:364 length:207 start_codon:yes stop_codon:yes gene_type:complete